MEKMTRKEIKEIKELAKRKLKNGEITYERFKRVKKELKK